MKQLRKPIGNQMDYTKIGYASREEFINHLDRMPIEEWDEISWNLHLTDDFIREFKDRIDFTEACEHHVFSEEFIEEMIDYVDWEKISEYQVLSKEFCLKHKHRVDWYYLSTKKWVTVDFIREYSEFVNWRSICSIRTSFPIEFIREFAPKLAWYYVFKYEELSEDVLRQYCHLYTEYDWSVLSSRQELSEQFMEDFADKLNWEYISSNQEFSDEFARKHLKRLSMKGLINNKKFEPTIEFYEKYMQPKSCLNKRGKHDNQNWFDKVVNFLKGK